MVQLVKNLSAMWETWVGKIPWRRERLPTPVFWPRKFHGLYSPWGPKELDTTERLSLFTFSRKDTLFIPAWVGADSQAKKKGIMKDNSRVSEEGKLGKMNTWIKIHHCITLYILCFHKRRKNNQSTGLGKRNRRGRIEFRQVRGSGRMLMRAGGG